jgi:oligoribonuclease NrnB/cAMP/cGMP phosphodiesterase (DHH superfamily)
MLEIQEEGDNIMVKLFTHTDLDGIGCAVLAELVFGVNADITYCNYTDIEKTVEEFFNSNHNCDCHITDISISKELAEKINNSDKRNRFQLLDHHNTALELNEYDWCKVQIDCTVTHFKTCGTELYYYWLINNGYLKKTDVLDRFVDLVRDWDTWRWTEVEDGCESKMLNDLFHLYKKNKFISWCVSGIEIGEFPYFLIH